MNVPTITNGKKYGGGLSFLKKTNQKRMKLTTQPQRNSSTTNGNTPPIKNAKSIMVRKQVQRLTLIACSK